MTIPSPHEQTQLLVWSSNPILPRALHRALQKTPLVIAQSYRRLAELLDAAGACPSSRRVIVILCEVEALQWATHIRATNLLRPDVNLIALHFSSFMPPTVARYSLPYLKVLCSASKLVATLFTTVDHLQQNPQRSFHPVNPDNPYKRAADCAKEILVYESLNAENASLTPENLNINLPLWEEANVVLPDEMRRRLRHAIRSLLTAHANNQIPLPLAAAIVQKLQFWEGVMFGQGLVKKNLDYIQRLLDGNAAAEAVRLLRHADYAKVDFAGPAVP